MRELIPPGSSYPMRNPSIDLKSFWNFLRPVFILMRRFETLHPHFRIWPTVGFRPFQASNGDLPSRVRDGRRLRMWQAERTASAHNSRGAPDASSIVHAISNNVRFIRSATPFD